MQDLWEEIKDLLKENNIIDEHNKPNDAAIAKNKAIEPLVQVQVSADGSKVLKDELDASSLRQALKCASSHVIMMDPMIKNHNHMTYEGLEIGVIPKATMEKNTLLISIKEKLQEGFIKAINDGDESKPDAIIQNVTLFLSAGADIFKKDASGQTPLHLLVKKVGAEQVKDLLKNRYRAYRASKEKDQDALRDASNFLTPLQVADRADYLPLVTLLAKEKETRDVVSRERNNKFYELIELGDEQSIGPLLGAVQDKPGILNKLLTDKTKGGMNALMLAAEKGHLELFTLLLNAAKVYPTTLNQLLTDKTEGGMNALMLAAQNGDLKSVKLVKLLLDAVHDDSEILNQLLTDKIKARMNALMLAASNGHAETVKTFLDAVKDNPVILNQLLTDKTEAGMNALMLAASNGHAETVKTFLDAVKDKPDILNKLLADKTISGQNALMFAASNGHAETVKTFLGAVKDKPDILKQLLADKDGQALLSHDSQRMGGTTKRKNALMIAAHKGHAETVKTFLDAVKDKPDILNKLLTDKTTASGENALMLAAGANHFELSDHHKKEYIPDAADMIREEIKEHLKGDGDDKNYAAANQALANLILLARRSDAKDGETSYSTHKLTIGGGHTETWKALLQWAYTQKDGALPELAIAAESEGGAAAAAGGGAAGGNSAETEFKQGLTALNNVFSDQKMTRQGVSKRKTILFGGPDSTFITEVKPPDLTLLAPPSVGGQSRPRPDAVTAAAAPEVEMIPLPHKRS